MPCDYTSATDSRDKSLKTRYIVGCAHAAHRVYTGLKKKTRGANNFSPPNRCFLGAREHNVLPYDFAYANSFNTVRRGRRTLQ